jgi:hypothetical protein
MSRLVAIGRLMNPSEIFTRTLHAVTGFVIGILRVLNMPAMYV